MLHCVILQGAQVTVTFSAPNTLELALTGVSGLMLGHVLPLLKSLVAVGTLVGLLPGVYAAVAVQVRHVLEAPLAFRTLEGLLARRVTPVLDKVGGGEEAAVAEGALQGLLLAVGVLVALQRGTLLIALPAHVTLVGLVRGGRRRLAALVPQQLSRLAELLLAGGALEQVVHAVHMLVVEQVGGLHEALVTQVAFEGPDGGVLVGAPVAHQCVLLLKAHLALVTVERPLLRVRALMLSQVGRALEPLAAGGAAEGASALRVAGVVEELRRLFKVQLAQVAFEQMLSGMGVHVAH